MSFGQTYVYNLLFDLDLSLGYAIWRTRGVTISGQTGRAMKAANPPRWARTLNGFLNWFKQGHCAQAYLDDIAGLKASIAYLENIP